MLSFNKNGIFKILKKIIYLRFLPINDNFLQDLSRFIFLFVCLYKTFSSLIGDIK